MEKSGNEYIRGKGQAEQFGDKLGCWSDAVARLCVLNLFLSLCSLCHQKRGASVNKRQTHKEHWATLWFPSIKLSLFSVSSEAHTQFYVTGVFGETQAEIEHHLEMGRKLLAAGQLAEALSHYHSAVGKVTHTDTFLPLADIFSLHSRCLSVQSRKVCYYAVKEFRGSKLVFVAFVKIKMNKL